MRRRHLSAALAVLALAACSAERTTVALPQATPSSEASEAADRPERADRAGRSDQSSAETAQPVGSGAPTRIGPDPLGPVDPGQRPPQVVVVAFDGAGVAVDGTYPMFDFWRQVSRRSNARFTYFLSGPYLLTHDNIGHYTAPQLGPATQAMPFEASGVLPLPGQTEQDAVRHELTNVRDAHAEGSEIGTHFNGHICGDEPGSVARFSAADWEAELEQFNAMIADANTTNDIEPPVDLGFTGADVVGSRTPCLQGDFRALYPVLERHGYLYDTSPTPDDSAPTGWPQRGWSVTGPTSLWVFPLAYVPSYGTGRRVLGMDYNLCFQHDGCRRGVSYPTSVTDGWGQQALDTYRQYFETNYTGRRAPVFIGNHFSMWHNGAYTAALSAFVTETCTKPEVRCVTYRELAEWLNATPADQLASWRAGDFERYVDPEPPAYGEPVPETIRPEPAPD